MACDEPARGQARPDPCLPAGAGKGGEPPFGCDEQDPGHHQRQPRNPGCRRNLADDQDGADGREHRPGAPRHRINHGEVHHLVAALQAEAGCRQDGSGRSGEQSGDDGKRRGRAETEPPPRALNAFRGRALPQSSQGIRRKLAPPAPGEEFSAGTQGPQLRSFGSVHANLENHAKAMACREYPGRPLSFPHAGKRRTRRPGAPCSPQPTCFTAGMDHDPSRIDGVPSSGQ